MPTATTTSSVIAEAAPIGVLLWPVTRPEAAPNFTLSAVETVRDAYGTHVRWVYENGNTRVFKLGESVAVQLPAAKRSCLFCDAELDLEAGLWVDALSGDKGGTYDHCPVNTGHGHMPAAK